MAHAKGPYKSSRPSAPRVPARSPLMMVTPQRRAPPVLSKPLVARSPPSLPNPRTPVKRRRRASPYHTPPTPTPAPASGPGQLLWPLRTSEPRPRLDVGAHPWLMARVMECASPSVLRAFRATSRANLRRADALLAHHLLVAATAADSEGELAAEICSLRPGAAAFVPHGRHPALRYLFDPGSASTPAGSATASGAPRYGGSAPQGPLPRDPVAASDVRLAVRQAGAVRRVLAATEVVDVAGRLSARTMRQLRALARNAQLYRLHLDGTNTHLLAEFGAGKRVTLALHIAPGTAAPAPPAPRGWALGAVRRLVVNVRVGADAPAPAGRQLPPVPVPPLPGLSVPTAGRGLEVVVAVAVIFPPRGWEAEPEPEPERGAGAGPGAEVGCALRAVRAAYAAGLGFALSLCGEPRLTCLGLDAGAGAALGLSDADAERVVRREVARLGAARRRAPGPEPVRFVPRAEYAARIGAAHFALETQATQTTHLAGAGPPAPALALTPAPAPDGRAPTATATSPSTPSFVVVDPPEGTEHYFLAPRARRRIAPAGCVLM